MRVATFNIRHGWGFDGLDSWPFRRRSTAAAIDELDADILGLQEVLSCQRRYLARHAGDAGWFGQGRDAGGRGEQCPVVVSTPGIDVVGHQTRWYGADPRRPGSRLPGASSPRIATIVRCRDDHGADFQVANTHLDERVGANRAASVRQLLEWFDPGMPTIVMGDFNTHPGDSAVFGPLADAGLRLVPVSGASYHGFSGRSEGEPIDHVVVSGHWDVADAAVVRTSPRGRLPSDHWPVRATVHLRATAPPSA